MKRFECKTQRAAKKTGRRARGQREKKEKEQGARKPARETLTARPARETPTVIFFVGTFFSSLLPLPLPSYSVTTHSAASVLLFRALSFRLACRLACRLAFYPVFPPSPSPSRPLPLAHVAARRESRGGLRLLLRRRRRTQPHDGNARVRQKRWALRVQLQERHHCRRGVWRWRWHACVVFCVMAAVRGSGRYNSRCCACCSFRCHGRCGRAGWRAVQHEGRRLVLGIAPPRHRPAATTGKGEEGTRRKRRMV